MLKLVDLCKVAILSMTILFATGCGQQTTGIPKINGVEGPIFNVVDGQVLVTFKFLNLQMEAGFRAPIPKTQNSFIEFAPNALEGGMLMVTYLDEADLEAIDIGIGDANYLPDGRPIPGLVGGKLEDSIRVDTDWHDISFFYSPKIFGLWIPVGFETAGLSGYWNVNLNQKRVGMLGLLGNDPVEGHKAGGILLLNLESLKSNQLQRVLNMSKRNPHLKY